MNAKHQSAFYLYYLTFAWLFYPFGWLVSPYACIGLMETLQAINQQSMPSQLSFLIFGKVSAEVFLVGYCHRTLLDQASLVHYSIPSTCFLDEKKYEYAN